MNKLHVPSMKCCDRKVTKKMSYNLHNLFPITTFLRLFSENIN